MCERVKLTEIAADAAMGFLLNPANAEKKEALNDPYQLRSRIPLL